MSSEREKEFDSIMEKLVEEYMARELKNATWNNVENLSFVFTYKKTLNLVRLSENLVKQSSRLSWLTVGLLFTSLGMIALAIAQLVVLSQRTASG
ncbi:MAG: hypothetical protein HYX79_08955 [Chloroflexi bacterium]|nr:hypothetical protein [Chloroflexota bacterium]